MILSCANNAVAEARRVPARPRSGGSRPAPCCLFGPCVTVSRRGGPFQLSTGSCGLRAARRLRGVGHARAEGIGSARAEEVGRRRAVLGAGATAWLRRSLFSGLVPDSEAGPEGGGRLAAATACCRTGGSSWLWRAASRSDGIPSSGRNPGRIPKARDSEIRRRSDGGGGLVRSLWRRLALQGRLPRGPPCSSSPPATRNRSILRAAAAFRRWRWDSDASDHRIHWLLG